MSSKLEYRFSNQSNAEKNKRIQETVEMLENEVETRRYEEVVKRNECAKMRLKLVLIAGRFAAHQSKTMMKCKIGICLREWSKVAKNTRNTKRLYRLAIKVYQKKVS